MFPSKRSRAARAAARASLGGGPIVIVLVVLAAVVTGCRAAAASFDPAGPCVVDGKVAGAYPDLEARLPDRFREAAPGVVDSGRHCTPKALASLATHELDEVRFAGATWDLGGGTGVTSVVFADPDADLPAAWIAEFYERGARTGKKTDNLETSRPAISPGGGLAWRLDVLNDLSFQTTVTWQDGALVRTVLVATPVGPGASRGVHDSLVEAAVAATAASSAAAAAAR